MQRTSESFRLNPVTLGALLGAVIAFVVSGAIVAVFWVALGCVLGAAIGFAVQRFARQANAYSAGTELREHATKAELEREASDLGVEGRSSMNKDELASAITDKLAE